MKFFSRKPKDTKPKSFIREWYNSIVFAVTVATLIRWSAVQAFVIPTPSMENSLLVGDYLFVSKLHYGALTPKTPLQIPLTHQKIWGTDIPSYLDWIQLPAYRLPAISHVKRMDVVVFNVPSLKMNGGIEYPSDLKTFYVKRCVGLPGDVLKIVNRQIIVNGEALPMEPGMKFRYEVMTRDEISERNLATLKLDSNDILGFAHQPSGVFYLMLLTELQVQELRDKTWVKSVDIDTRVHDTPDERLFPVKHDGWTQDDYGALTIPAKGMSVGINDSTLNLYGEAIKSYEGNSDVEIDKGKLRIAGKDIENYVFKQNYYFMMGDSRHNSLDSRYWGFVPEDHIVGKPLFVWFSVDGDANLLHKVRWSRIFTLVK